MEIWYLNLIPHQNDEARPESSDFLYLAELFMTIKLVTAINKHTHTQRHFKDLNFYLRNKACNCHVQETFEFSAASTNIKIE